MKIDFVTMSGSLPSRMVTNVSLRNENGSSADTQQHFCWALIALEAPRVPGMVYSALVSDPGKNGFAFSEVCRVILHDHISNRNFQKHVPFFLAILH